MSCIVFKYPLHKYSLYSDLYSFCAVLDRSIHYTNIHYIVTCHCISIYYIATRIHRISIHSMATCYVKATISRLLKITGLFCKRAL